MLEIGANGNTIDFALNQESLFIGINNDGLLFDYAYSSKDFKKYYMHPDTKTLFKNYKIDLFPKVLDAAIKLHSIIPWIRFCKWDITIDVQGNPVVIEMENPNSPLFTQIANVKGVFENNTKGILSFLQKHR
jgi:hypothetical protein